MLRSRWRALRLLLVCFVLTLLAPPSAGPSSWLDPAVHIVVAAAHESAPPAREAPESAPARAEKSVARVAWEASPRAVLPDRAGLARPAQAPRLWSAPRLYLRNMALLS
ncbi:MAG: hypothetical protein R3B70_29495 [Polyangiaceae bacterium]